MKNLRKLGVAIGLIVLALGNSLGIEIRDLGADEQTRILLMLVMGLMFLLGLVTGKISEDQ